MSRWVCVALLLVPSLGAATTVRRASLDELTRVSGVILHGVVRAVDDELGSTPRGPFRTAIEIEVLESFKGLEGHATLRLELPGGRAGGRVMRIPGMPRFVVGDEIVIFLEPLARGGYAITGLGQGVFRVGAGGALHRDLRGLELVDARGAHVHSMPVVPATLVDLEARVREVAP